MTDFELVDSREGCRITVCLKYAAIDSLKNQNMEIQITDRNVSLTTAQVEAIERRLQYAIGRFAPRIRVARVTLTDLDGPNEATDILCRLKVTLKKDGDVIVGIEEHRRRSLVMRMRSRDCGVQAVDQHSMA